MLWHKSNLLCIQEQRGDDNLLDAATVHLHPHPALQTYLALSSKKDEVIRWDNLSVVLQDTIMQNLLRCESLYDACLRMAAKYGETGSEPVQVSLNELKENLELIEMELQGDTGKL